jgi:hypothetical protein
MVVPVYDSATSIALCSAILGDRDEFTGSTDERVSVQWVGNLVLYFADRDAGSLDGK